jgi:hypothetical protein
LEAKKETVSRELEEERKTLSSVSIVGVLGLENHQLLAKGPEMCKKIPLMKKKHCCNKRF